MAVTESVKIVFEVDDKALVSTVQQLQAVGKVSQEDAAKFNELSNASKAVATNLDSAATSASSFAKSGSDIAKSTTEIGKSSKEISNVSKSVKDAGNLANDAGKKFTSLKSQLAAAKNEAALAEKKFGEFSRQAIDARNKAGLLADQVSDLNRQVALLNPESKVQAFTNFGQGIVGAFQVATGALQAFGVENEQVQQIAQRLQGVLNLAQGIQSIVQLKESFKDLSIVISSTVSASETIASGAKGFQILGQAASAAAESGDELTESLEAGIGAAGNGATLFSTYKKAQDASTISTKGATVAQNALNRTMLANPVFLLATSLGALVGALILYQKTTEDANQSEQEFQRIKNDSIEASKNLQDAEDKLAIARDKNSQSDIDKRKNFESLQKDLIILYDNQRLAQEELNKATEKFNQLGQGAGLSVVKERKERLELATQLKKDTDDAINNRIKEFNILGELITRNKALSDFESDRAEKARKQAESERLITQAINDRLFSYTEEQKLRSFTLQLNKLYGATEEEILRQKIFNNQADQESLEIILEKAKGTKQYELIQSQLNDKVREEILLRKELENELEVTKIELRGIRNEQEKNNEKAKEAIPIAKEVGTTATELNEQLFARNDAQKEQFDVYKDLALEFSDYIFNLQSQRLDDEQAQLENQREQNLITEEQYQEAVLQLRKRQAQADKNSAVFNASIGLAEAIIKALNAPPPVSFQSVALASAIAAAQLAKIIATPLPKFKKGTLSVPGTDTGDDSVMAMLRPGEAVIPTEINREYASTIKAIYTRKVSSKDLNDFVNSRMTVVRDEPVFNFNPITMDALFKRDLRVSQMSSALQRSTGASMPTINVKADVDTYALGKVIGKNKSMEVTNVESIGEAVAEALSRRTNRRQQI